MCDPYQVFKLLYSEVSYENNVASYYDQSG